MTNKITFNEKWIDAEKATYKETVDPKSGKKRLILSAMIVPFNKISRNGVMYNKESIIKTHETIPGKPLMHNHVTDGQDTLPRGEWFASFIKEDGLYGEAEVYQTNYNSDYIEWLENSTSPKVSLNITGNAEQKKNKEGKHYQEAFVDDWLEISSVVCEGFVQAKASLSVALAEAFKSNSSKELKTTDEEEKSLFHELKLARENIKLMETMVDDIRKKYGDVGVKIATALIAVYPMTKLDNKILKFLAELKKKNCIKQ